MISEEQKTFMREAIKLAVENVERGKGGPFGAVIVKDGKIIASGVNQVTSLHDPTAHAEVVAIRMACATLNTFQLVGCKIYASCEPCPMCLAAIYWAKLDELYFANTKEDAGMVNFNDEFIYEEINRPISERKLPSSQLLREEGLEAFKKWVNSSSKIEY